MTRHQVGGSDGSLNLWRSSTVRQRGTSFLTRSTRSWIFGNASHGRAGTPEVGRMRAPSGEDAALVTDPVWPWSVNSGLPSRSHIRAVPPEVVRMRPPSGEN